jgi:hypothetical protein
MEDMHVLEGFMHDLISLPKLLKKGCEVVKCTSELIRIHLPFQKYDYMDFKHAEDGLFYLDAIPLDFYESVEQANSNIMPDDDSSDDDEGNTDGDKDHNNNNNDNADNDMDMDTSNGDQDTSKKLDSVDINRAHELCNHPGKTKLREMAKVFGWKLTGVLKACSACAKVKATAKGIPKMTTKEHKASRPGEVLHLDMTGPYKRTHGKSRYLVCIKDALLHEFGVSSAKRKPASLTRLI